MPRPCLSLVIQNGEFIVALLADIVAQCRIYRNDSWTSLGECRIRLHHDSFSLEVHDPSGPYCLDLAFDDIDVEIEEASTGPLLFVRLKLRDTLSVVEVRSNSANIHSLLDAILIKTDKNA